MTGLQQVREVPRLPARDPAAHKGTCGTALLIAGSEGMLGAAILCARGAVRGGAGLVRAILPAQLMAPFTVAVPSAVTLPRAGMGGGLGAALAGADAVAIGPGLGQGAATLRLVRALLARARVPVVLDADALNVLAPLAAGAAELPGGAPRILTPHPGEAARLLDTGTADVQRDRPRAAAELAARSGGVVVLKGAGTLVTDGARLFTNGTGNPGLATGGSGDVLTGLLLALLAQGMEPFAAACLGVHVHGAAGDLVAARLSQPGLSAEDLPLAIAEVLR